MIEWEEVWVTDTPQEGCEETDISGDHTLTRNGVDGMTRYRERCPVGRQPAQDEVLDWPSDIEN